MALPGQILWPQPGGIRRATLCWAKNKRPHCTADLERLLLQRQRADRLTTSVPLSHLQRAARRILSARPSTEISAIITRPLDEVSQHFHDKELILEIISFPGMSQHVSEHAELLAKGLELAQDFKASTLTVGDVFQFLAYEVVTTGRFENWYGKEFRQRVYQN